MKTKVRIYKNPNNDLGNYVNKTAQWMKQMGGTPDMSQLGYPNQQQGEATEDDIINSIVSDLQNQVPEQQIAFKLVSIHKVDPITAQQTIQSIKAQLYNSEEETEDEFENTQDFTQQNPIEETKEELEEEEVDENDLETEIDDTDDEFAANLKTEIDDTDDEFAANLIMKFGGSKKKYVDSTIKLLKKQKGGDSNADPIGENVRTKMSRSFVNTLKEQSNIAKAKEDAGKRYDQMIKSQESLQNFIPQEEKQEEFRFGGQRRAQRQMQRAMQNVPMGTGPLTKFDVHKTGIFGGLKEYTMEFGDSPLKQMTNNPYINSMYGYGQPKKTVTTPGRLVSQLVVKTINNETIKEVANTTNSESAISAAQPNTVAQEQIDAQSFYDDKSFYDLRMKTMSPQQAGQQLYDQSKQNVRDQSNFQPNAEAQEQPNVTQQPNVTATSTVIPGSTINPEIENKTISNKKSSPQQTNVPAISDNLKTEPNDSNTDGRFVQKGSLFQGAEWLYNKNRPDAIYFKENGKYYIVPNYQTQPVGEEDVYEITDPERIKKIKTFKPSQEHWTAKALDGSSYQYRKDRFGDWRYENSSNKDYLVTNPKSLKSLEKNHGKNIDFYTLENNKGYYYRKTEDKKFIKFKGDPKDHTYDKVPVKKIDRNDQEYSNLRKNSKYIGELDFTESSSMYQYPIPFQEGGSYNDLDNDMNEYNSKDTTDPYFKRGGFNYNPFMYNRMIPGMPQYTGYGERVQRGPYDKNTGINQFVSHNPNNQFNRVDVTKSGIFGRPKEYSITYNNNPTGKPEDRKLAGLPPKEVANTNVPKVNSYGQQEGRQRPWFAGKKYEQDFEDTPFSYLKSYEKPKYVDVANNNNNMIPFSKKVDNNSWDNINRITGKNSYGGLHKFLPQAQVAGETPIVADEKMKVISPQQAGQQLYDQSKQNVRDQSNFEPDEYTIDYKRKNMFSGNAGEALPFVNAGITGISNIIDNASNQKYNNSNLYNSLESDNLYGMDSTRDRGKYDDASSGLLKTDQTGSNRSVQFGGSMEDDDIVDMTEEELEDFLNAGGEVEYI